ncbi:MAG: hypothetical protein PHX30_00785 [Candidatus Pacebacteria bacterium]|jgi:hypothetical protein|nr:hypothetical protein [Candidatus Paceibacterota bacterium]
MSKLYKCAKGCGSIEETDEKQIPACCGVDMVEISEDEVFGCGGCCSCCGGCGTGEDEDVKDKK